MARIAATFGKSLDSLCTSLDAVNDGVEYAAAAMQQLRKEQQFRHKIGLSDYAADLAVESGKRHADRMAEIAKIAAGDETYSANFTAGYEAALQTLGLTN